MQLVDLNALPREEAVALLRRCCGSTRWSERMAAARPFTSVEQMAARGDEIWASLDGDDWREAFAAHPKIGDRPSSSWAAQEQAGAQTASADVRERLARGNQRYQDRFGHTFIVCATGRTA